MKLKTLKTDLQEIITNRLDYTKELEEQIVVIYTTNLVYCHVVNSYSINNELQTINLYNRDDRELLAEFEFEDRAQFFELVKYNDLIELIDKNIILENYTLTTTIRSKLPKKIKYSKNKLLKL